MDTKTLKVGQDVHMFGGHIYDYRGKVVKITPDGVDVADGYGEIYHFDTNGKEYYRESCNWGPEWCPRELAISNPKVGS
jgi:hypothetical protein